MGYGIVTTDEKNMMYGGYIFVKGGRNAELCRFNASERNEGTLSEQQIKYELEFSLFGETQIHKFTLLLGFKYLNL